MSTFQKISPQIRWLIRRDLQEVLKIELTSFEIPWNEEDFLHALRQRNCIGMVAEWDGTIVGFMLYELHKSKLHILNFAVHRDFRRFGVGSAMVARLLEKLSAQRREEISLHIRESNLDAQLFFKSHDFRAVNVLRNFYEDTEEDAYYMRHRIGSPDEPYAPRNRMAQYFEPDVMENHVDDLDLEFDEVEPYYGDEDDEDDYEGYNPC